MSNFLVAIFFGGGVAAFTYNKFARRIGYTNTQNVTLFVGAVFIFATLVAYTILAFIIHA